MSRIHLKAFALIAAFAFVCNVGGAADSAAGLEFFESRIRPLLLDRCIDCHGQDKQEGGLRLDSREGWMSGGDSGPAIVQGKPAESILIKAVEYVERDFKMPPKGKLPSQSIEAFSKWIEMGAPDPRSGSPEVIVKGPISPSVEEGRSFWSFQPVGNPPVPQPTDGEWAANDIDRFVLEKLERAGLQPAADAASDTITRRLYFDLIGLPPTPEQIAATGERKLSAEDIEGLVDELLASRHFGERWGRHWLDVVRFAQSSGGGRTLLMPDAWRYRDYVIDAFNADMPYDQFLREQIAGDLLPSADWRQKRRQITATAFLVLGPTNYELQDKDILEMDIVDEQLDTLGKAFMGMTIGCARCHDHKFDPIPATDYYGMAGIFKSTRSVIHNNVSKWSEAALPVAPEEEAALTVKTEQLAALNKDLSKLNRELKALGGKKKSTRNSKSIPVESLPGIVVDNISAIREGMWTESTSTPNYVGRNYLHDANENKGAKSVSFAPQLPMAGRYEVQIASVPGSNRSSNTPVTVHHAGGSVTIQVNQRKSGPVEDYRTLIGVFEFDPADNPRVVISNQDTDGVVIADAVLFIPIEKPALVAAAQVPSLPRPDQVDKPEMIQYIVPDPSQLAGIVIDNTEAELVGEWKHSVHTPPFVGASYIHDAKEGKGAKSATFTPDLPQAGDYEVRISHNSNVRRSTNALITIRHADGLTKKRINQGEPAPIKMLFRSLGTYRFEQGRKGSVTISTEGTDGKYVIVDAVQFIRQQSGEEKIAEQRKRDQAKQRAGLSDRIKKLKAEIKEAEGSGPKRDMAMAVVDAEAAKLGDIPIAIRGVVSNKGPIVPRSVMQVATLGKMPLMPADQSGRLEFANWLTSPEHPLTSRVIVNRAWYWLFGRGLVDTVDNFGATGSEPSHPELLDHLAAKFVAEGWSVKQLVRHLVLSRTYRMASASSESGMQADPDNRLLWRMKRKRLDAESIRDSLLLVGGTLDLAAGGSNIKPNTKTEYGYEFDSPRRSVYLPVFRNTLPEIFETFDFADPNIQAGSRSSSTIAPQALLMMNSPFVIGQSKAAAKALLKQSELTIRERINRVYLQVVGRRPSDRETQLAQRFIGDGKTDTAWPMFYQALFQSIDFRYLK